MKPQDPRKSFGYYFLNPSEDGFTAGFFSSIGWSFLYLNLFFLAAILVGFIFPRVSSNAMLVIAIAYCGITFGVCVMAQMKKVGLALSIFLALSAWIYAFSAGVHLGQYSFNYLFFSPVENVSVQDALKHRDSRTIKFTDGQVLLDKYGSNFLIRGDSETSSGSTTSYMVPFVPAGWTEKDSVNVWLFGEEDSQYEDMISLKYADFYEELQKNYRAGIVMKGWNGIKDDSKIEAIQDAEEDHKIKSAKDPMIIEWCEDPEKKFVDDMSSYLGFTFYCNIGWVGIILIHRLFYVRSRRKKKSIETVSTED